MKSKVEAVLRDVGKGAYIFFGSIEIADNGQRLTAEDLITVIELTPNKDGIKLNFISDLLPLSALKNHPKFWELHVDPASDLTCSHYQEIWRRGNHSHMLLRTAQRFENEDSSISRFIFFSVIDNPDALCDLPQHLIIRGEGGLGEGITLASNPLEGDQELASSFKGDSTISILRRLPRFSMLSGEAYYLDTALKIDAYQALLKSNIDLATQGHYSEESLNSPYHMLGISQPCPEYVAYLTHLHTNGVLRETTHIRSQSERERSDKLSDEYLREVIAKET